MGKEKLPDGWRWSTLKKECIINPRKPQLQVDDQQETSFVPMEAVDGDLGTINEKLTVPFQKVKKGYTYFEENDVLFAKITPCMQNKKSAIAKDLINGFGFGSTEFHVLRCKEHVIPEWIYYFVRNQQFIDEAEAHFTGAVGQQRVPTSFIQDYPILIPPPKIQQDIVARLDSKMTLIKKMRNEIEKQLLTEDFSGASILKSFFSNYGTDKKLKLKDLVEIKGGGTPSKSNDNFWTHGKYDWISVKNIVDFKIKFTGEKITEDAVENSSTNLIPPNSLIIATRMMNKDKITINSQSLCINQDLKALIPKENLDVNFLFYFLRKSSDELKAMTNKGATVAGINQKQLLNLDVDHFSLEKQKMIVKNISEYLYYKDMLYKNLEKQSNAVNRLPASLLYEVFGKYEIPEKV